MRYLRLLALHGTHTSATQEGKDSVPQHAGELGEQHTETRQNVDRIALALWGLLLNSGIIEPSTKLEAKALLAKHSKTYLAPLPYLQEVIAFVESVNLPVGWAAEVATPRLVSDALTSYIPIKPQQHDDLSERIYAAWHVLKAAGVRNIGAWISGALQATGRRRQRADESGSKEWTPNAVRERIRSYEKGLRKGWKANAVPEKSTVLLQGHRKMMVQRWLGTFRYTPLTAWG